MWQDIRRVQVDLLEEDVDEAVGDRRAHDDCACVIDRARESIAQRREVE